LWLNKVVEDWSKQGRTEEQIYGVKNFITGLGGIRINEQVAEAIRADRERIKKIVEEDMDYDGENYSKMTDYGKGSYDTKQELLAKIKAETKDLKTMKEKHWVVLDMGEEWQAIVPNNDINPHTKTKIVLNFPDGKKEATLAEFDCPCKPNVNFKDKMIIHNSFDGREKKPKLKKTLKN